MKFNKPAPKITDKFREIVGKQYVFTDEEHLFDYSHDETGDLSFLPDVVIKPRTPQEISEILKICNEHKIAVTPRGAGTGLSGGALPVHGGISLSIERFNKIIHIDEQNFQAVVEPGVITQVFQETVIEKGLFYPPDPASRGSCFLGGNVAENSGGPKAVKYGVVKDYVLNLEVVLPNGAIVWTGANVLKNATGYNLTQLMVGSEGTLGIITKIVFKLIPHPKQDLLMLVPFNSAEKACQAVAAIMQAGITPSGLEFMERDAIMWSLKYVKIENIPTKDHIQAWLLIEVDGNEPEVLFKDCEKITEVVEQFDAGEVLFADTSGQKEELWKVRRCIAEAVKSRSDYIDEDTVVPRAKLPMLLKGVKEIGKKYQFNTVCYGHAGDGNLHVNILKENISQQDWKQKVPEGIREIFQLCKSLGGTISGEHGIGYIQKPYINIAFDDVQLGLMRGIKELFDPKGVLNPGKIF